MSTISNLQREFNIQVESSHSLHKLSVSSITNLSFLADEDKHVTLHVSADEVSINIVLIASFPDIDKSTAYMSLKLTRYIFV